MDVISNDNYINKGFEDFKVMPKNQQAVGVCKGWESRYETDDSEEWTKYHHFLTIAGECGRGKTFLAKIIFSKRLKKGDNPRRFVFIQVPDLLNRLKAGFEDKSYEMILNGFKKCELLVLDDLGMQKNTEWVSEQLDSLIDYRYDHCLDTIFTTNLALDKLPQRIASRISEGEIVVLLGEDYRQIIAKERITKRQSK